MAGEIVFFFFKVSALSRSHSRRIVLVPALSSKRWEDQTIASLWKRSQSFSSSSGEAPFSKLTLSKLLVLKDKATREDYFAQQAAFVMLEGRKDVHAVRSSSFARG